MNSSSAPRVLTRSEHSIADSAIHPDAWKVLRRLHAAGHTAYLVGGTVRDLYLGRTPKDSDVATTARPNDIKRLFRNAFMIGRRFRLAHVKFFDNIIEVATFRRETDRFEEPEVEGGEARAVRMYGTPEEDARRRDFTINGLFYDPFRGLVIDYVGGLTDMERRLVRTISPPDLSYEEDPVRMIRAVRAAARLGFAVEASTHEAILRHRESVLKAPRARLLEELLILLKYGSAEKSLRLLWQFGLMEHLLPLHHAYLLRHNSLPFEPPHPDVLFDLMSMLDLESSHADPPVLFALLLLPFVTEHLTIEPRTFWQNRMAGATITVIDSMINEFAKAVDVSKRFHARALEILTVQPRLIVRQNPGRPEKLVSKPYFADSFRFFQIACKAVDLDVSADVAVWLKYKSKAPSGAPHAARGPHEPHRQPGASAPKDGQTHGRRRRRRRRHGPGGGGPVGSPEPAPAQSPQEPQQPQ